MIYKTADLYICVDCLLWLANGDATGLDNYRQETAAARLAAIQEGERQLVEEYGQLHTGGKDGTPWRQSCDCCCMVAAGRMHHLTAYTTAAGRKLKGWTETDPPVFYAADPFILSASIAETEWQKMGLSYTASGYGAKIPTRYMVQCADNRQRRVYCRIYGNSGSLFIMYKGQRLLLDIGAESKLETARDTADQGEKIMTIGDIMARGSQGGRYFEIRKIEGDKVILFTWWDHGDTMGIFGWREQEASSYHAAHKMALAWLEKELLPMETRDLYNQGEK